MTEGPDVADSFIVESSSPGDLCVTADIPLASRLVDKGLIVIDPRGDLYSEDSIGERLSIRDFMAGLREMIHEPSLDRVCAAVRRVTA